MKSISDTPPWLPVQPEAGNAPPGPDKLKAVIAELDVVNSKRYRAGMGKTWCNIFVTDVIEAMGFEPGHWVDRLGSPAKVGEGEELSANKLVRWLITHGPARGWAESDRNSAMAAAERGHLVVVAYDSKSTKHSGHVAILLPEGTIAQAGRTNFVGRTIREGFGVLPVKFFVQMRGGSHKP